MGSNDFSTTIVVDQTPKEAFDAINNVRGWWSEQVEGNTTDLNGKFNYYYQDVHRCKMKLIEVIANQKVVWLVLENYFSFTEDQSEWVGNKIVFEITPVDNKTQIKFTQFGLVPSYECYTICNDAWSNYIQNSLRSLIATGEGKPNGIDKPQTEHEKQLGS